MFDNSTSYLSFDTDSNQTDEVRIYDSGNFWTNTGSYLSNVLNSSTSVGYTLNTSNQLLAGGSKLLSVQNQGSEKMYLDKDGNLYVAGSVITSSGNSILLTNKSSSTAPVRSLVLIDNANVSSFKTISTQYTVGKFGVVVGVGLGASNDVDGDGVCDVNDKCVVAYAAQVS